MTTEATAPTTTTPAAAPPQDTSPLPQSEAHTDVEGGLDQRADKLIAKLNAEAKAAAREEPADEETTAEEPVVEAEPAKTEEKKPEPAAAKTAEQIATERRERLAAIERMAEEERAKVAAKRQRPVEPAPAAAPPPQQPAVTFDPKDPASVFRFIEAQGIPPAAVADWLSSANDPARAAEVVAKKHLSPLEQQLAEVRENQKRLEQTWQQQQQALYEQQLVAENQRLLVSHLDSVKSEAPLAARFYARSPAKFMAAVDSVCARLPDGFTAQDVIDSIEENLSELQLVEAPAPAAPASSTKRKEPAAAKANVGNRLAAERGSVVDDEEDTPADLEERARRLKARLAAAG